MPNVNKAERRDKKRQQQRKMRVNGRGLLTDAPDWEDRLRRAGKKKEKRQQQ